MMRPACVLLATAACMLLAFANVAANPLLANTTTGNYLGRTSPKDSSIFRWTGMRYASAPVGNLRWRPPVPYSMTLAEKQQTKNATSFGASCPQVNPYSVAVTSNMDEDCLFLNVWSPIDAVTAADPNTAPLPVAVWIHGGGFYSGSSVYPDYDGTALVAMRRSIVFVSINYRLGAYGFLTTAALDAESGGRNASGFYGLEDQRAALQWIRANIRKFGGDPKRVTIMGESAGSFSVCMHMASELSNGLFHGAVLQSGPCTGDAFFQRRTSPYTLASMFASKTRCGTTDNLSCMRTLTVAEIRNATEAMDANVLLGPNSFFPYIDGFDIAKGATYIERFKAGTFNKVPVMIGSLNGEFALLLLGLFNQDPAAVVVNQALYDTLIDENSLGDPRVKQYYTAARFASVDPAQPLRGAVVAALTDRFFTCGSRFIASSVASSGQSAYLYHFIHAPVNGIYGQYPWMGAFHYAEVLFMFGNPADQFNYTRSFTPSEQVLSQRMMNYWINFVESGSPNSLLTESQINDTTLVTNWPRYSAMLDEMLIFDTGNTLNVERNKFVAPCQIWDTLAAPSPAPARQPSSGALAFARDTLIVLVLALMGSIVAM